MRAKSLQVGSNADKTFRHQPEGIILYPAVGAPEVLGVDAAWIHLLMLLPNDDEHTLKQCIQGHLGLYTRFDVLRGIKDHMPDPRYTPSRQFTHAPQFLVGDLDSIHIRRFTQKSGSDTSPWQLAANGWHGVVHQGIVERYRDCPGLKDASIWEIAIETTGLVGSAKRAWESGRTIFLHWGHPDGERDVQTDALYRILSEAVYKQDNPDRRKAERMPGVHPDRLSTSPNLTARLFVGTSLQTKIAPDEGRRLWNGVDLREVPVSVFTDTFPTMDVHPVYRRASKHKSPLRLGFISDLHLVNKFRSLKNCDLHSMPKGAETGAPSGYTSIGDTMQDSVDVLSDLFQQLGAAKDIDAVVIGGDLVDFCEDNWPEFIASLHPPERDVHALAKPGPTKRRRFEHIWDSSNLNDDPRDRERNSQAGLTTLGFLHLVMELAITGNKPVYVLAGNHDSYQAPFGISPRVGPTFMEVARGNEGIAADCNLTIQEAVLAFGKDYWKYFKANNFTSEVGHLFHLLFNPLRSWTTPFGGHQFLFLDWGDDEAMLWHQSNSIGHLPHATESCSDADLDLTRKAIASDRPVTAFSHFTWACYDPGIPIDDKNRRQRFAIDGKDPEITPCNVGTCRLGRETMFGHFHKGEIRLAVSGHAHRASLYVLEKLEQERPDLRRPRPGLPATNAHVCAWHFDESGWRDDLRAHPRTVFVVADSAGPIPRENRGRLEGWGSRSASWTWISIRPDGVLDDVEVRATEARNSLPRLAVSLDYLEYKRCGDLRTYDRPAQAGALVEALHDPTKAVQQAGKSWGQKILSETMKTAATPSADAIARELEERAEAVRKKADATKATLEPWSWRERRDRMARRTDPLKQLPETTAPIIDPVATWMEPGRKQAWEHFGHDSRILSNFVSEPIRYPQELTSLRFFHNPDAIALPDGVRIGKVSLFVWEGMEVQEAKNVVPALKESWLKLERGSRAGEWIAQADHNLASWGAMTSVLSDGRREHASSVFLCFEFEGKADGYDTSSPWVVCAQWEDDWVSDELGRRVRIFRNVVAHENPDHEIWRLAEYAADQALEKDRPRS